VIHSVVSMDLSKSSFWGYRRVNGRVGECHPALILPAIERRHESA